MAYVGLLLAVLLDNSVRLLVPMELPDLPLITALYVGFHARNTEQLWYAIALGAAADCFSSFALGHFAFLYGAAAYLAWRIRRFLPPDPGLAFIPACLFCGLVTAFLALLLALISAGSPTAGGFLDAIFTALLSAVSAPLFFGLWSRSRLFRRALGGRRYYEFAT